MLTTKTCGNSYHELSFMKYIMYPLKPPTGIFKLIYITHNSILDKLRIRIIATMLFSLNCVSLETLLSQMPNGFIWLFNQPKTQYRTLSHIVYRTNTTIAIKVKWERTFGRMQTVLKFNDFTLKLDKPDQFVNRLIL